MSTFEEVHIFEVECFWLIQLRFRGKVDLVSIVAQIYESIFDWCGPHWNGLTKCEVIRLPERDGLWVEG